jgi:Catalytic LigB subunit of aromatic ring-opening dioxygenase
MAQVVRVLSTSHSPFCYMPPEHWNNVRASRALRADVPLDSLEVNQAKAARIKKAFGTLRAKLAESRPDVVLIFGDDQRECFDFENFPAFAVYVGPDFEGNTFRTAPPFTGPIPPHAPPSPRAKLVGHPEFAVSLLTGLMEHGFDPAFCMEMPNPERGVGHAFLRPSESLTDFDLPTVPVFLNCYYAPQPTAMRCYQFGRAVREVIDAMPSNLRVAVVGAGGLWHTPGASGAWLDEAFDHTILDYLKKGDVKGMAKFFDGYTIPGEDSSQDVHERTLSATGMPGFGGPQGGTRETCNWIAAAAVVDGCPATIEDYVPVYASPIGAGFAYWDQV